MNEKHEIDTLVNELESLAQHDRNEPDSGFERRVAAAVDAPIPAHRHRKKKSTAWIPFAAAAAVGGFAFFWWPTPPSTPTDTGEQVAAEVSDASVNTDIWLASLDTMDQLVAMDSVFSDDLDHLELQLDTAESYFTSEMELDEYGESL